MSDADDHVRDALHELLASEGFALLKAHAAEDWGEVAQIARMKRESLNTWPQVLACSEAVASLLAWPAQELQRRNTDAANAGATPPLVPRRA